MRSFFETDTFIKLDTEIKGLASLYFKALELSKSKESNSRHLNLVNLVRNAYSNLNQEERKLINNEFFYQKYPNWWKDSYSLYNFRRLKYKSMTHFLEVFYDNAI